MKGAFRIKSYKTVFIKGSSLLFILLFIYAALSKVLDYETFTLQLAQSPLLSAYAGIIAFLVPGLEIVIALLLVFERWRMLALYASFMLMVMFTAYIFFILNFSDFVPCSCGGVLEKLSWTQHLIFNVVFIILAGVAVFFAGPYSVKKTLLLLVTLAIIGISIVALLFVFSEKKMHRNNAFQRRYIPHPIEKIGEIALDYDTFYLAGYSDSLIYLGNYGAPLYLTTYNIYNKKKEVIRLELNNTTLPFRKIKIVVHPPDFTIGDGTVPVLFRGSLLEKKAYQLTLDPVYFTQFVATDSNSVGLVTVDAKSKKKTIHLLSTAAGADSTQVIKTSLTAGLGTPFADDGILEWNANLNYFLYTYYYKNKFEVMDNELRPIYVGSTIDTIESPILDIGHSSRGDRYTLGGKSVMVNKITATAENYLFVNSDRLGRLEEEGPLRSASIIDVYDVVDRSYAFSFYLYHQPGGKLYDLQIHNGLLIALVEKRLFIYKLKPAYFHAGLNTTHTGQYQDEDRTPVKNSRSLIH